MKIAILGCKGTTLDLLSALREGGGVSIDQVVTLPPTLAATNRVAYWQGDRIVEWCRAAQVPCHQAKSYNLADPEDQAFFDQAGIDLLVVIGWERLVPTGILARLGRFACGMHGSARGLPKGRGRSPMNWAVLTGQSRFITYLFRYTPGIDDGDIIGFKVFDITAFDTIASLHAKNRIAMTQLLQAYAPLIERNEVCFAPQPPGEPTYYPKRSPEDGAIDWFQSTEAIYNLIRAVAPPYPGAFSSLAGRRVEIHAAQPFDQTLFGREVQPGTVVDIVGSLQQFVVKTADGSLLVTKFAGIGIEEISAGAVLISADQDDVLRRIKANYPDGVAPAQREI